MELRDAFLNGDIKRVKKEAGTIFGALACKFVEIAEKINEDGLTLVCPKLNSKGEPVILQTGETSFDYVMEHKEHPLLKRLTEMAKVMGINPSEFGVSKEEIPSRELKGNITNVEQINIQVLLEEQDKKVQEFSKILESAKYLREKDPVFKRFSGDN